MFSSTDAKRMKDVEYCCMIYILANEGMVDQTNGKKINDYYDDYKDEFDEDNILQNKIMEAIDIIESMVDKNTISFVSKKAQMYTLFSVVFKMMEKGIYDYDPFYEKFSMFVDVYSKFRNEFNVNYDDESLADLYSDIKKYKLASSEGINKISNRIIRFETLYKVCVESEQCIMDKFIFLREDFEKMLKAKNRKDSLEKDDLVDIEEI